MVPSTPSPPASDGTWRGATAPPKLPRALAVNTGRNDLRSELHLHVESLENLSVGHRDACTRIHCQPNQMLNTETCPEVNYQRNPTPVFIQVRRLPDRRQVTAGYQGTEIMSHFPVRVAQDQTSILEIRSNSLRRLTPGHVSTDEPRALNTGKVPEVESQNDPTSLTPQATRKVRRPPGQTYERVSTDEPAYQDTLTLKM